MLVVIVVGAASGVALRDLGALDVLLSEKIDVSESERLKKEASDASFKAGEEKGYDEGKSAGYAEGYDVGMRDGMKKGAFESYVDGHMGIRVADPGSHIQSVTYTSTLGTDSEPGVCVNLKRYATIDKWGWAFVRADGTISSIQDDLGETGNNWCYYEWYLIQEAGQLDQFDRLAVYVFIDGTWDRKIVPMPLN